MAKRIQRTVSRPRADSPSGPAPGGKSRRRKARRVPERLVTEFTLQLSTLSAAGIPIVRALKVLAGQARPGPFKRVLGEVVEDVSAGTPLSEAMAKHEGVFDPLYSSMVHAGEAGGVLDQVLDRLAVYRERIADIRSQIARATIYPAIIVLVAITVVSLVVVFVIPRFRQIFDSFDVELPTSTQILLNVCGFTVDYWYAVFGTPIAMLLMHGFLMRRGGAYRYLMHRVLLRLPLLGDLVSTALVAAFSRTFGTLLQAGVPHLDALGIVRDTTANEVLLRGVEDIRVTVREGEGIARPMSETAVFDDLVCNMVVGGEVTGELDNMLIRVADAYEKQVDRRLDAFFRVLEPALVVTMAVVVGFLVWSLFQPLMKIMSTLSQG
jgi:type IV pilus assembly protein PilC